MCNDHTNYTNDADEQVVSECVNGDEFNKELIECRALQQEWKDRFMRLSADFENYKRRMVRDQSLLVESAQQRFFLDILPIVDDFDRALQHPIVVQEDSAKAWLEGVNLIRTSLTAALKKWGVEQMSDYTEFDPIKHEAIANMQADGSKPAGCIMQVVQSGYMWKDKVLRPAQVIVAQ